MTATPAAPSKIGPNSIIQTVNALEASMGKEKTEALLRSIGQDHFIGNLPTDMTDESKFHALVTALDTEIGARETAAILEESGSRTAEYLLRVRIPGLFQKLLKLLPAGAAFSLLFFAISKNAWTFAGSGEFTYSTGKNPVINLKVLHPSRPSVGSFFLGTFTHLIHELVNTKATITPSIQTLGSSLNCTYRVTM